MMKKTASVLMSLILLLTFGACSKQENKKIELNLSAYTPPAEENIQQNITLYSYNASKGLMVSTIKKVPLLPDQTRSQTTLETLLASSEDFSFVKNQNGVYDYNLTISNKSAIVNFTNPCPITDDFKRFQLHMSIVNTLSNLDNINNVTVLAANAELGGKANVHLGPLKFYEGNINTYFQELSSHSSANLLNSLIFYMDKNNNYILPETATLGANNNNIENSIRETLRKMAIGPNNKPDLVNTINPDLTLNSATKEKDKITLDLSKQPMLESNSNPILAYGSITLTLKSMFPDLNSVRFLINGTPLPAIQEVELNDGLVSVEMFKELIGNNQVLFFARKDRSSLLAINRAVSASQYNNPTLIVENLLSGPTSIDDGFAVFPKGFTRYDFNSCTIINNTAIIDFKATFFDNCKSLDKSTESVLIYSIVNSLTQIEHVKKVQFLIEGQKFETITGNIFYNEPLVENPGLVLKQ